VTQHKNVSDETARKIDEVVRGILVRAYERSRTLLTQNLDKLHTMAKLLLQYETIDAPQIEAVMTNREPPAPTNWSKGGPAREQPKPFTIGGPAPQT
jgi:cell division protease FtsH